MYVYVLVQPYWQSSCSTLILKLCQLHLSLCHSDYFVKSYTTCTHFFYSLTLQIIISYHLWVLEKSVYTKILYVGRQGVKNIVEFGNTSNIFLLWISNDICILTSLFYFFTLGWHSNIACFNWWKTFSLFFFLPSIKSRHVVRVLHFRNSFIIFICK